MKNLIIMMLLLIVSSTYAQNFDNIPDKYIAKANIESFEKYDFVDQMYVSSEYDSTASMEIMVTRLIKYQTKITYIRVVFNSKLGKTTHDYYVSNSEDAIDGNGIYQYEAVDPFGNYIKYERNKKEFIFYYDKANLGITGEPVYKYIYRGVVK